MAERTWRIETKHRKGCHAVRNVKAGTWRTAWAVIADSPSAWATPSGNTRATPGRRTRYWIRLRCNDGDCPGTLLLNVGALLVEIGAKQ